VELTVEYQGVDALLYDLIGHGWSVRTVAVVGPGQPEPRS
jgi:hypothetical protein